MTTADEVRQRAKAADIDLTRIVFVNNSGVPRGRVVDTDGLEDALEEGVNITQAMQSFTARDLLAPEGQYGPAGEMRIVPDPDTVRELPYDDRAGLLLADLHGLDGIERELDPGDPLNRDPGTLDDDALRGAMGDALVDAYVQVKRSEWQQSTDEGGEWESEYLARGF